MDPQQDQKGNHVAIFEQATIQGTTGQVLSKTLSLAHISWENLAKHGMQIKADRGKDPEGSII